MVGSIRGFGIDGSLLLSIDSENVDASPSKRSRRKAQDVHFVIKSMIAGCRKSLPELSRIQDLFIDADLCFLCIHECRFGDVMRTFELIDVDLFRGSIEGSHTCLSRQIFLSSRQRLRHNAGCRRRPCDRVKQKGTGGRQKKHSV